MILLISTLCFLIFLFFVLKKEAEKPEIKRLQYLYAKGKEVELPKKQGYLGMFFFSSNASDEYDYLNSMKIVETSHGVFLIPTINHCMIRSMFIPWTDLKKLSEKRLFLIKRRVFLVVNSNIVIAF